MHHRHRQATRNEQHPFRIDMKFVHYAYCILMEMVSHHHARVCVCVCHTMDATIVFFYTCSTATQSSETGAEGDNIRYSERGSPPHIQAQLNKGLPQSAPDFNRGI